MNRPRITVIAALSGNGVIGRGNRIPWRAPNEMRHFQRTTMHQSVIMGRKTLQSLRRPLAGRMSIAVSRNKSRPLPACEVRTSPDAALLAAAERPCREVFIAGGGEIYLQTLPHADRLLLSRFKFDCDGDTFFPELDRLRWKLVRTSPGLPGEHLFLIEEYVRAV